jgi:hypothetical protein
MAGRDINNAIDSSANEFLSAFDNEIIKMQDIFDKQLAAKKKSIELEYDFRAQLEKELLETS